MSTPTPITVSQTSNKGSVNVHDVINSLLAAVVAPVIPIITESLQAGSFTINWKSIGVAAALGFVVWLTKNFIQPAQTIISGTTEGSSITVTAPPAGTTTTHTATAPTTSTPK
jgi:hypothetical protein